MADESKLGTDWSDGELDIIVADYFAMLEAERVGRPYIKAQHARDLMAQTGRSHRSVEFKHMNISAVLRELGMPTIRGYRPMENVQRAIFSAIDRFLTARPALLTPEPPLLAGMAEMPVAFEEAPPLLRNGPPIPRPEMERLVRKFDPVERDFRNRALGEAGEALVIDLERRRLRNADRTDLARKVRWVAKEDGNGAGYDVRSFDPASGGECLLEVKTTFGGQRTPFFLTRNEMSLADERPEAFRVVRLYDFGREPRLFRLHPPLGAAVRLEAETWRAGFG